MITNLPTATAAAKVATGVLLAHATGHIVAPETTAKRYAINNTKGRFTHTVRRIGVLMLTLCIISWCLIFQQDISENHAYALASTPFLVDLIASALSHEPEQFGYSARANNTTLILGILLVAGFVNESANGLWTRLATAVTITMWFVHAMAWVFIPRPLATKVWGIDSEAFEQDGWLLARAHGICCAQLFVFMALLSYAGQQQQLHPVRALAYSFAVLSVGLLFPVVIGDQHKSVQGRHVIMALGSAGMTYLMLVGELEQKIEEVAMQDTEETV